MALRAGSSMLLRSLRSSNKMSSRAMSQMSFTFAAPNGVHYNNASVKQIDVPSFSGSFGILPDHVPALAVLSPGVITVFEDSGDAKKFFVSSGTVTINDDSRSWLKKLTHWMLSMLTAPELPLLRPKAN